MTGAHCLKMANRKRLVMCISAFWNQNIYYPGMQTNQSLECHFLDTCINVPVFMKYERLREMLSGVDLLEILYLKISIGERSYKGKRI